MMIAIAGGGTGGHVFPALAVAEEIRKRKGEVIFIGTKKGLESELIPKKGYEIKFLKSYQWKGKSRIKKLKTVMNLPWVVFKAMKLLKEIKPDIILGVGGYVSVPAVIASAVKRIPIIIMEQNSIPGVANRWLGRFATKVCITFPESKKYFKEDKIIFTGNPIREKILKVPDYNLSSHKFTVMCFGGSQGAKHITEALLSSLKYLRNRNISIRFIHQIGRHVDEETVKDIYKKEGFEAEVYKFIDDMEDAYARAQVVICRSGATSIAELTAVARPAVLIPYPHAANNHQQKNAEYIADNGGAVLIKDNEISGKIIAETIEKLSHNREKLKLMSDALKKLAKPNAAKDITEECYNLVA